jgi:hypothetical protein
MAEADDDWLGYLGEAHEVIRRWEQKRLYGAILTIREAAMLAEEIAIALHDAHDQGLRDGGSESKVSR